jgi:hypothetical protein
LDSGTVVPQASPAAASAATARRRLVVMDSWCRQAAQKFELTGSSRYKILFYGRST